MIFFLIFKKRARGGFPLAPDYIIVNFLFWGVLMYCMINPAILIPHTVSYGVLMILCIFIFPPCTLLILSILSVFCLCFPERVRLYGDVCRE